MIKKILILTSLILYLQSFNSYASMPQSVTTAQTDTKAATETVSNIKKTVHSRAGKIRMGFMNMNVDMQQKQLSEYIEAKKRNTNGGKALHVIRHQDGSNEYMNDTEFNTYKEKKISTNSGNALHEINHSDGSIEYMDNKEFAEYCAKPNSQITFVRIDGQNLIPLTKNELEAYIKLKKEQNNGQELFKRDCIRNNQKFVEYLTDKELMASYSVNTAKKIYIVRSTRDQEIFFNDLSEYHYEIYKRSKIQQNCGQSCVKILHGDQSIEYLTDQEYALHIFKSKSSRDLL